MRKFLFFPRHEANFYELIGLASLLAKDNKVFFLIVSREMLKKFEGVLEKKKIHIIDLSEQMKLLGSRLARGIGFGELKHQSLTRKFLANNFLINLINSILFYYYYLFSYLKFKKIFNKTKIDKIFICGDRELGIIRVLLKFAKSQDIKTVMIHNAWTDSKFFYHTRIKKRKFSVKLNSNLMNFFFFSFFKTQIKKVEGIQILYSPCWVIIPLYFLGMLPKYPWCLGKSSNSKVFLDCMHSFDQLKKTVNIKRLCLTGSSSLDKVFKNNTKLKENYSNTCIICMPFFAEIGYTSMQYQLNVMNELIEKLDKQFKILISLHPKANQDFYRQKLSKHKVKFLIDNVENNFHQCDFIICCNSLVIKKTCWVDLPAINYDFLSQKFPEINLFKNVFQMFDISQLEQAKSFIKKYKRNRNRYFSNFKFPSSRVLLHEVLKD